MSLIKLQEDPSLPFPGLVTVVHSEEARFVGSLKSNMFWNAYSCSQWNDFFPCLFFIWGCPCFVCIQRCSVAKFDYLLDEVFQKLLYFEWSPPWHVGWRLSGEGCHWEYDGKNGEFENIDFRFPWLSDTSEMGFGHGVPFLNYSDRLPHPSDLCQPDRVRWG